MDISERELQRFGNAADTNEIAMMLGRYVTLMDQMEAMPIYDELFAKNDPEVSVEYDTCGSYVGPEHTKAFFEDFAAKLSDWKTKRGWLDFHDAATPEIIISNDGKRAKAMWSLLSPKAKSATPISGVSAGRTLMAFWQAGKMHWELVKTDDGWKILNFHLITYFTAPFESGWLKQSECHREEPFWSMNPDKRARFYVYHPDQVYVKGAQYTWGPYLPDEGTF